MAVNYYEDPRKKRQTGAVPDGGQVQQQAAPAAVTQGGAVNPITGTDTPTKAAAPAGTAPSTADLWSQQPAPYNPVNQEALEGIYNQIMGRPAFTFDLNSNPFWQGYKDQYTKLGSLAMQDTMGQAAGLTGGYASTYGQQVGQQAYNAYLQQLNGIVPELYDRERAAYDTETQNLYNMYGMLNDRENQDYSRYMDSWNQWWSQVGNAQAADQWAQQFAWQQATDQRDYEFQREQWEWQKANAGSGGSGGGSSGGRGGSGSGGGGGNSGGGDTAPKPSYYTEDYLQQAAYRYYSQPGLAGKYSYAQDPFGEYLKDNKITNKDDVAYAKWFYSTIGPVSSSGSGGTGYGSDDEIAQIAGQYVNWAKQNPGGTALDFLRIMGITGQKADAVMQYLRAVGAI